MELQGVAVAADFTLLSAVQLALTVALATIWGGSAMNPQYLFCAETNRYGEFRIETVIMSVTPGTMLRL